MTIDEAKALTIWMRDQGVAQFSVDDFAVQFQPSAIAKPVTTKGAEDAQPPKPESPKATQANLLSRVVPRG